MSAASSLFIGPELEAWLDAASNEILLFKRCLSCGEPHYYPRPFCPFCFSENTVFEKAAGIGTIYSYTIARAASTPFVFAYVTLDEGPTLVTNIINTPFEYIAVGKLVLLRFREGLLGFREPVFEVKNKDKTGT